MTQKHELVRTLAIQTAFNSKGDVWLTKQLQVKQIHNFTGGKFLERFEYKNNKVTVYDFKGKEIKIIERTNKESKEDKKIQNISKLSNASDDSIRKSS